MLGSLPQMGVGENFTLGIRQSCLDLLADRDGHRRYLGQTALVALLNFTSTSYHSPQLPIMATTDPDIDPSLGPIIDLTVDDDNEGVVHDPTLRSVRLPMLYSYRQNKLLL